MRALVSEDCRIVDTGPVPAKQAIKGELRRRRARWCMVGREVQVEKRGQSLSQHEGREWEGEEEE